VKLIREVLLNLQYQKIFESNMAKKDISYNEAITEIEEILYQIENEELDIDILTEKVKKVSTLLKLCKKKLHQTETEVQKILDDIDDE